MDATDEEEVAAVLREWGLAQLIPKCSESMFNLEAILELDENNVHLLTTLPGLQLLLLKRIKSYKERVLRGEPGLDGPTPPVRPLTAAGPLSLAGPSSQPSSSASAVAGSSKSTPPIAGSSKRPATHHEGPAQKKLTELSDNRIVYDLDLRSLLQADSDGKQILLYYEVAEKAHLDNPDADPPYLSNLQRNTLARVIVDGLQARLSRVRHQMFADVEKKILEIFPTEEEGVYYKPPLPGGKGRPEGKLASRLRNESQRRKNLILAGQQSAKSNCATSEPSPNSGNLREILKLPITEEVKGASVWLERSRSPWPQVLVKWRLTLPLRFNYLLSPECDTFVNSYLVKWPVLKHESGYELLLQDFSDLYPDKVDALYSKWDLFANKTFSLASRDVKDRYTQGLLQNNLDDSADQHKRGCLLVHILPAIRASQKVTVNKVTHKLSIQQIKNGLFVHAKSANDLRNSIRNHRSGLAGTDGGGQPLICFVGPSELEVTATYVAIADMLYHMDGVVEALDLYFKSFHSLHIPYPPEVQHILIVLQKAIYNISTEWDSKCRLDRSWANIYTVK